MTQQAYQLGAVLLCTSGNGQGYLAPQASNSCMFKPQAPSSPHPPPRCAHVYSILDAVVVSAGSVVVSAVVVSAGSVVPVEPTLHRSSSTSPKAMPVQPGPPQLIPRPATTEQQGAHACIWGIADGERTQSTDNDQHCQACPSQRQAEVGAGLCLPAQWRQPALAWVHWRATGLPAGLFAWMQNVLPALLGQQALCAALLLLVERPDVVYGRGAQHLPVQ